MLKAGPRAADLPRVSSAPIPTGTDVVLVRALRPAPRSAGLLQALDALPRPQQAVLRGSYLEGRADADLAADLQLTPAELDLVRGRALRALGRTGAHTGTRRAPDARGALFSG